MLLFLLLNEAFVSLSTRVEPAHIMESPDC